MSPSTIHQRRQNHVIHNNGTSVHNSSLTGSPACSRMMLPRTTITPPDLTSSTKRKRRKRRQPTSSVRTTQLVCLLVLVVVGGVVYLVGQSSSPFSTMRSTRTEIRTADSDRINTGRTTNGDTDDNWTSPLIHLVHTRFMQEQSQLLTLGEARLRLFETFCFPTMIHQSVLEDDEEEEDSIHKSDVPFLWIIQIDPLLQAHNPSVFQQLIDLVLEYDYIYVIGSNTNHLVAPNITATITNQTPPSSWRNGGEGQAMLFHDDESPMYTGNRTLLLQAYKVREERIILETRLDADDGLHRDYLYYLQEQAKERFTVSPSEESSSSTAPQWLYWCTRRHLEWHSSSIQRPKHHHHQQEDHNDDRVTMSIPSDGILNPIQHDHLCVTPGLTIGYNIGTLSDNVPLYAHDVLYRNLMGSNSHSKICYDKLPQLSTAQSLRAGATIPHQDDNRSDQSSSSCLELVQDLLFCAIRSRTWTSAGMQQVAIDSRDIPNHNITNKLWDIIEERFHINYEQVVDTQTFLVDNRQAIAHDNYLGQCTTDHSCKEYAKEELKLLMEKQPERT